MEQSLVAPQDRAKATARDELRIEERVSPATEALHCGPQPAFGRHLTPAMLVLDYKDGEGWVHGRIDRRAPVQIEPSAVVLNYGQAIFEGLKAYRQPDGRVAIFRLRDHAERFRKSAARVALPDLPPEMFVELVQKFVRHQARVLPEGNEISLYLRPLMLGTDPGLGVHASKDAMLLLFGAVVGPYFGAGKTALKVRVTDEFVRAAPGGTGSAKFPGNYTGGLLALRRVWAEGCDQVMYLDAREQAHIEEMEGMNVFVVTDGVLHTPRLSDTILDGITRSSLITLARARELSVREELVSWLDVKAGIESGRVTEVFAAGTAAVVAPISELRWKDATVTLPDKHPVADALRQDLRTVQSGTAPDRHGWRTIAG